MTCIKKSVGEKFRNVRKSKKMTQMDIADKAGLSHNFVSLLERGNKNASIDSLELLSDAVDCQLLIEFVPRKQKNTNLDKNKFLFETKNNKFELKVVNIELVENNLFSSGFEQRIEELIWNSDYDNLNLVSSKLVVQQRLLSLILESGILDKYKKNTDKLISICFESDVDDCLLEKSIQILMGSITGQFGYAEKKDRKILHYSLFTIVLDMNNTILIKINNSISNDKIDEAFRQIIEKSEERRKKIIRYVNDHPNGFPYVCCLEFDLCSERLTPYKENSSPSLFSVYNAWSCKDATNKFVEDIYSAWDGYYFEHEFVNDFASLLYWGDLFDLEEITTKNEIKTFAEKVLSDINLEKNDIGSDSTCSEYEQFKKFVCASYSNEKLKEKIGIKLYTILLKQWVFDNSIVRLDKKAEQILKL